MAARAWLLAGITVVLFVSPLRMLWASDAAPWWTAFAVWAATVGGTAIATRARRTDDAD